MGRRLAALALWAAACVPAAGPQVPPPLGPPVAEPAPLPPVDLAGVAAELDPGEVTPLVPELPEAAREAAEAALDPMPEGAARLQAARARLDRWAMAFLPSRQKRGDEPIRRAVEGLLLAEPLALGPPSPLQREAAALLVAFYAGLSWLPGMQRFPAAMAEVSGLRLFESLGKHLVYSDEVLRLLAQGAERRWRSLATRLLRDGATPPALLDGLFEHAAEAAAKAQRWERACHLHAERARRAGGKLDAAAWLALGDACYAALDLPRGDWAVDRAARARKPGDDLGVKLARVRERREAATEALRLRDAADVSDRARAAVALVRLGRDREALRLAEALAASFPDDARPATARVLAQVSQLGGAWDLGRMAQLTGELDRFADKPNLDRTYWSLRVGLQGMRMTRFIGEIVSDPAGARRDFLAELATLRRVSVELGRHEPGTGAVLVFLADLFSRELADWPTDPKAETSGRLLRAFRATLDEARRLVRRFPDAVEPRRLLYAAAVADPRPSRALAALAERPPMAPAAAPRLYLERARAYLGIAVRADDLTPRGFASLLAAVPDEADESGARALLAADALALAALEGGGAAAWKRAAQAYARVVDRVSTDKQPRVLNNWGFALVRAGERDAGLARLLQARRDGEHRWVPRLNLALAESQDATERLVAVTRILDEEAVRTAALAWAAHLRAKNGDAAGAAREAREAVKNLDDSRAAVAVAWGRRGALIIGSFQAGLGIQSHRGHVLSLNVEHDVWLIEPPPIDEPTLRRLAKRTNQPHPLSNAATTLRPSQTHQSTRSQNACAPPPPHLHLRHPTRLGCPSTSTDIPGVGGGVGRGRCVSRVGGRGSTGRGRGGGRALRGRRPLRRRGTGRRRRRERGLRRP